MWLIVDQSLAAVFFPIKTRQQRASLPFKPGQGHRLQVKLGSLSVMEDLRSYITMTVLAATHYHTRAWQTLIHGKECFILLMKTATHSMDGFQRLFTFFSSMNYKV